jgi:2-methylcitrate dehydratase PrpD
LEDERVLELASRIELVAHDDFSDAFPKATPGRVIMDQGQGPERLDVPHPRGDVANPMNRAQIVEKFKRISRDTLREETRAAAISAVDRLPREGFQPLFAALRGS